MNMMILDLFYKINEICFKEKMVDIRYTMLKKSKRITIILSYGYEQKSFNRDLIDYDKIHFCIKHMTKKII